MDVHFIATPARETEVAELSALLPANPFATAGFFEARRQAGYAAWVLGLKDDGGELQCGCGAFLKAGKLNRTLEIRSLPAVGIDSSFWDGLREFCRQQRVTHLELGTFGSPPGVAIPPLASRCTRTSRSEFILHLTGDLSTKLSQNHKRRVKKAHKAGLAVRRTCSAEAVSAHQAVIKQSMDRRQSRGEDVRQIGLSPDDITFLQCRAGELFQALRGDNVLSSALVLRAPEGGYYHTAGTSAEGMALGASHFLVHNIAGQLRAEGAHIFNLGGADEGSSLAQFKEWFGASRVVLPSATCYIGSTGRYVISCAIAFFRSDRGALRRLVSGRLSRMIVYTADTGTARPGELQTDLVFRALMPGDLLALSVRDPSFRDRQLERLGRFGASHAYAVFAGRQIAHVSWLLPHTAMEKDPPRVFRARASDAEITCCETLPEFRGRGIYSVAIRNLLEVARAQGISRVFMKTTPDNKASQSGIEKAGLQRVGSAILIVLPVTQRLVIWRRFR